MKVLVIGNGRIDLRNGHFFCSRNTGVLLKSLDVQLDISLVYAQFVSKSDDPNDHLTDFDLGENEIKISMLNAFYGNKFKYINYIFAIIKILILIRKSRFVYIFWPGQQSKIVGVICSVFRKRYGLYVRGDFNINRTARYIFSRAEFVLSVSDYFSNKLKPFCDQIYFEPPLIDLSKSDIYASRPLIASSLVNFLFVGRIEKAKGILELIDAFSNLIKDGYDFHLDLVGGGDLFLSLQEEIKLNKVVANRIRFHGIVSDKKTLLDLYRNSDAFILPSHTEGFPRVFYEAMAAKIPIYTTFVGGIPSVMKHGENCIELPIKDSKGIYSTIAETYNSQTFLNHLTHNALLLVERVLSQNTIDHPTLLYNLIKSFKKGVGNL